MYYLKIKNTCLNIYSKIICDLNFNWDKARNLYSWNNLDIEKRYLFWLLYFRCPWY